jgi:hypothetical protein
MRQSDRNGGSIKALVIFALLVANIVVALSRQGTAPSSRDAAVENPRFSGRMHEAARFVQSSEP